MTLRIHRYIVIGLWLAIAAVVAIAVAWPKPAPHNTTVIYKNNLGMEHWQKVPDQLVPNE